MGNMQGFTDEGYPTMHSYVTLVHAVAMPMTGQTHTHTHTHTLALSKPLLREPLVNEEERFPALLHNNSHVSWMCVCVCVCCHISMSVTACGFNYLWVLACIQRQPQWFHIWSERGLKFLHTPPYTQREREREREQCVCGANNAPWFLSTYQATYTVEEVI